MEILQLVRNNFTELVNLRRYLHKHPELSGCEEQTVAYIEMKLSGYGIAYTTVPNGGVVGVIEGCKPGKTLLLRADMDALPIKESACNLQNEKICLSENEGVSHACGHDAHTAMLLVASKILQQQRQNWPGKIVLCFERGEEGAGNIKYLLDYIENYSDLKIDGCYGTHVRWNVPVGKMVIQSGAVMAGGFGFEIRLTGRGGHGSRPDMANSPLDCFTAIYHNVNMLRLRKVTPFECLTFSIGKVYCGEKLNIVPDELTFAGTARFFDLEAAGQPFIDEFLKIVVNECSSFGCTFEVLHMPKPIYEVRNDPVCTKLAQQAVTKCLGTEVLTDVEPWMASETMSTYLKLYPGVFTFTGIANAAKGTGANHHTPEFDVDEDGMLTGAAAAIAYALEFLNYPEEIAFTRNIVSVKDLTSRNI